MLQENEFALRTVDPTGTRIYHYHCMHNNDVHPVFCPVCHLIIMFL